MKPFSFNTIDDFDNHISKSIPSYDVLIEAVKNISPYFLTKDQNIYDLGCSTGSLLNDLALKYKGFNECVKVGYDNSKLLPNQNLENLQFIKTDLNKDFVIENACLVYSIFTMQFLNKHARQNYCDTIYNGLSNGGAFFLCEKVYSESGFIQEMMTLSYYQNKRKNFDVKEILDKEEDLRSIMKPNTLKKNIETLKKSGFKVIETFWRSYNFVGLICIKN